MKRALKGFGNVLGNCLGNKNYLRWANKYPVSTPSPPQKSETVLEVPADVHRSRYNAMTAKATATSVSTSAPPASVPLPALPPREKENQGNPSLTKQNNFSLPKEPICKEPGVSVDNTTGSSGARSNEATTSVMKDDLSNETDPAKLERKRRQQQKKEEFLQQLKRRKSDESIPGPSCIKSEEPSTSPIPEGSCFQIFDTSCFECRVLLDCFLLKAFNC